ncbi:nitrate reductase associated protein [Iningainema tapete]|uniref:Nitrate reductase associated protein n=1 Tax=Iningainema tapete BLCC-T55 TaxID=2748662 RepID=A0A8J6XRK3_9CYAN|nr:nitrate reductase associated protein [Iningainema tapete]MBD2777085.1 nitrate reductase associated protein [Iningainema tapete BLCC-T55]
MTNFFKFEADFVDSLRCIPMLVRCKLDTCGIKLKLSDWNKMTQKEREALVELPCTTPNEVQAYRDYLQNLILQRTGTAATELSIDPHPAWKDTCTIPDNLQEKAKEFNINLTLQKWSALTELQRFALIKLSRSGHENENFPKAIAEFNLV